MKGAPVIPHHIMENESNIHKINKSSNISAFKKITH